MKPEKKRPADERKGAPPPELPPAQTPDEVGRRAGRVGGVEHRDDEPDHDEILPPLEPGETFDPDANPDDRP